MKPLANDGKTSVEVKKYKLHFLLAWPILWAVFTSD
jgi:hypothetical protein